MSASLSGCLSVLLPMPQHQLGTLAPRIVTVDLRRQLTQSRLDLVGVDQHSGEVVAHVLGVHSAAFLLPALSRVLRRELEPATVPGRPNTAWQVYRTLPLPTSHECIGVGEV